MENIEQAKKEVDEVLKKYNVTLHVELVPQISIKPIPPKESK